ncbi:MAG: hypothetical protein ACTSPG_03980 [Candidatus Hodarchaeales archaeon]
MAKKQMFGSIGLSLFGFLIMLVVVGNLNSATWSLNPTTKTSLEYLWTDLFPAVLIQIFVIFAALLSVNLQFTPVKEH